MNDLEFLTSIVLSFFSSIIAFIIAIVPLYQKVSNLSTRIGKLEGELKILKEKLYSLCHRVNEYIDTHSRQN